MTKLPQAPEKDKVPASGGTPAEAGIKAVIFDLGRVLIDFDHRIAARRIARFCSLSEEEIYALFFDSPVTGLFEEGKISPRDFFLEVKKILSAGMDYGEFVAAWNSIFFISEKNRRVHELIRSLQGGYQLILLTNINALHLEFIAQEFSLFEPFGAVIASCREGVRKPDPLIYQAALRAAHALPQEVFYTDDRPELIEGARKLGIRGFVFSDAARLACDLAAQGVKLQEK
ncbi:MAG: HAD family phosphatase [Candidatus Omnitrophica bacterium]|nr:HAD family phosphatase [Candidatus Omnitrophota bacterium]